MKKAIRISGAVMLICCLCMLFAACSRKYTVTFRLNGGTLVSGELVQTVDAGDDAVAPKVEMKNMTLSWNKDFSEVSRDMVVTAQWTPICYNVRFDLNGGELISGETEQRVEAGTAAVAPEAANGRLQLSWDTDFSNISGDTVVTAQWEKVKMDTADLAEYVQERTVTVNTETISGSKGTGSGFFIDEEGTIVTNWHVIEGAADINVMVSGGGKYDVEKIVDFSEVMDLAIIKIDIGSSEYLELCGEAARSGEKVYAVGSALGTLTGSFTSGIISSTKRMIGNVEYLQMDAAISNGNSGGPLVNEYGEVVGINTLSYVNGENLNMAIKIETLEKLKRDKNWSVREFTEWYTRETARSYSPWDGEDAYYYSTINTYQTVTGRECICSLSGDDVIEGYVDCCEQYAYEYDAAEFDQYVEYLKGIGFAFEDSRTESDGSLDYIYYNEKESVFAITQISAGNLYLLISICQL